LSKALKYHGGILQPETAEHQHEAWVLIHGVGSILVQLGIETSHFSARSFTI
jgi:hypothetical protein